MFGLQPIGRHNAHAAPPNLGMFGLQSSVAKPHMPQHQNCSVKFSRHNCGEKMN
jgi:hypothetical protein